jgi:hypothetical protein
MSETNVGGQPGNQNARKGSMIRGAIRRALAEDEAKGRETLQEIVRKMIEDAANGDRDARRELFDRVDGKPQQQLTVDGDGEGGAIKHALEVRFVE